MTLGNSDEPNDEDKRNEKVGYKNPPKAHRFKKGQSGNPKGRPKGSKNVFKGASNGLFKAILREAKRSVNITENGSSVTLSTATTVIRSINTQAMKGNIPAARLSTNLINEAEHARQTETVELAALAHEYKRNWSEFIQAHKRAKVSYDIPTPHPDHVCIDPDTLEVSIEGPQDKDMLMRWKGLCNKLAYFEVEATCPSHRPNFVERAMEYVESDDPVEFTCCHEDQAIENGTTITCEEEACWLQKRYDEDELSDLKYYRLFRERVSFDDPIWKEFGPQFIRNWIDNIFYYGPNAHIEEEYLDHVNTVMDENIFLRPTSETKLVKFSRGKDSFRNFMRKKIPELMGDKWSTRLDNDSHTYRDIQHDRMRYLFEIGEFDLDRYEWEEADAEMLADPKKLAAYMAWT